MPDSDPRRRLLDDILNDNALIAHRQRLLSEAERCLLLRRRVRSVRRLLLPLAAGLVVATALTRWWMVQSTESSSPKAVPVLAARRPPKGVTMVQATPESVFVSTVEILRSPSVSFAEFSTLQVPLNLQVIPDQELLALFSDRGAMLLSQGISKELWLLQQGRLQAVN
jgi:hypothetical protein